MRRSSPSPHGQFFNSLKQLEKRLKLENNPPPPTTVSPPPPPPPPPPLHTEHQANISCTQNSDSLGTPMYIVDESPSNTANTFASTLQESEIPREFLSDPNFPSTHGNPPEENHAEIEETLDQDESRNPSDEIGLLMQLLGLSDSAGSNNTVGRFDLCCDDGFYERIVGVKGPKSGKEVERLEGWIKHFLNGEVKEPFRLAHLLLAKAAFLHLGDGFGGFEFPCTIAEFFENDPPVD